jgi:hypothetical protein
MELMDNNENEYDDYYNENNHFIEIKEKMDELEYIDNTIEELIHTMDRYNEDSYNMWRELIVPFISSADCVILDNIYDDDPTKFIKFMMKQKTYRLMEISFRRLLAKRYYIIKKRESDK